MHLQTNANTTKILDHVMSPWLPAGAKTQKIRKKNLSRLLFCQRLFHVYLKIFIKKDIPTGEIFCFMWPNFPGPPQLSIGAIGTHSEALIQRLLSRLSSKSIYKFSSYTNPSYLITPTLVV